MRATTHADPGHKVTEREMSKMLIGTVLSVLICLVSLVSLTWAWFSDGVVTETVTVTAAYFTVDVQTSTDGSSYSNPVSGTNKEYTLQAGTTNIKLTSGGNATKGFFLIEANGNKYYTDKVNNNQSVEIKVSNLPEAGAKIKIIPAWGGIPTDYETVLPQGGISFADSLTAVPPKKSVQKPADEEKTAPTEEDKDIPEEEIEEKVIPGNEDEIIKEIPAEEPVNEPAETPTEETEE